ncbi:hypothetical protein CsSME_00028290 [Camellia sinensis var. sinensis]
MSPPRCSDHYDLAIAMVRSQISSLFSSLFSLLHLPPLWVIDCCRSLSKVSYSLFTPLSLSLCDCRSHRERRYASDIIPDNTLSAKSTLRTNSGSSPAFTFLTSCLGNPSFIVNIHHHRHGHRLVLRRLRSATRPSQPHSDLVLRVVKSQFLEFHESTIEAMLFSQMVVINDTTMKFEIWDTAGQEGYHSLTPMCYKGASIAIIIYD